jgi:formylglycine-generating enzyme required for sulfatase activity
MRGVRLPDLTAKVTAYPLSVPPDYAVWDLSAADVPASLRFYPDAGSVPGGIKDVRYATTHLLMRKIRSGGVTVRLGTNKEYSHLDRCIPRLVTFSRDYYIGVFELTQGQCRRVWQWRESPNGSNRAEADRLPVNRLFFDEIRGSQKGRLWPAAGESDSVAHQVDDGSLIDAFRKKTGLEFDLPTAAQWEYAYRGGCPNNCFWGMERARETVTGEIESANTYAWTTANCTEIQPVGTLQANDYGLYDMAGNVSECCLNWFTTGETLSDGSDEYDPRGPTEAAVLGKPYANGTRVVLGGSYSMDPDYHVSAVFYSSQYCNDAEGAQRYGHIGLRLVCDAGFLTVENQKEGE